MSGWRVATLERAEPLTDGARTLVLRVPGWPGHLPGQHVDVRLTAPDGYQASRSYSIASASAVASDGRDGELVELGVELVPDGEVSPYLVGGLAVGDAIEVRGPLGGWFVWRPDDPAPVQLLGGGSGVVPLVAMARAHAASGSSAPLRLLHSVRGPHVAYYREELAALPGLEVDYAFTREVPPGWAGRPGRVDAERLARWAFRPEREPTSYVCGPTGFVETVADALVAAGHEPRRVRTERFGAGR